MDRQAQERLRRQLVQKRLDLTARLERIRTSLQRGLDPDSSERAKQLEDSDVVDTLGKGAGAELLQIQAALSRMDEGRFGVCTECGSPIEHARLRAYPYSTECSDCAQLAEVRGSGG